MSELLSIVSSELTFSIDPAVAGRVADVRFAGRSLLTSSRVHPDNWGATLWTSPQADWAWPPVPEVDHAAYEVLSRGTEEVRLRGPVARIGEKAFSIEKSFRPAPHGCIDVDYVIQSVSEQPFRLAPWEISRVGPHGVTFFPTGDHELTPIPPHGPLVLERVGELSVFDHRTFRPGMSRKVHADGREGFLAHATDGLLLLKFFVDSPSGEQAPLEGEIEIFANEDGKYVEVEVQGPFVEILPGERASFSIRTHVARLPEGSALEDWVRLARALRRQYFEESE